jgi:hypothetical protein
MHRAGNSQFWRGEIQKVPGSRSNPAEYGAAAAGVEIKTVGRYEDWRYHTLHRLVLVVVLVSIVDATDIVLRTSCLAQM